MANLKFDKGITALLVIDPYNDRYLKANDAVPTEGV